MSYDLRRRGHYALASVFGVLAIVSIGAGVAADGGVGALGFGVVCLGVVLLAGRQLLQRGPALVIDERGVEAWVGGTAVAWSDVTSVRHDILDTPNTRRQDHLVLGLNPFAEPRDIGVGRMEPQTTADGGRELWIPLAIIAADPYDVVAEAQRRYGR